MEIASAAAQKLGAATYGSGAPGGAAGPGPEASTDRGTTEKKKDEDVIDAVMMQTVKDRRFTDSYFFLGRKKIEVFLSKRYDVRNSLNIL